MGVTLTYKVSCDYCGTSIDLQPYAIPGGGDFYAPALPYPVLPEGWRFMGGAVACERHYMQVETME